MRLIRILATFLLFIAGSLGTPAMADQPPPNFDTPRARVPLFCGKEGLRWNVTRMPPIGCFGLASGGSATGEFDGHELIASVDSDGLEHCRLDDVTVPCNVCSDRNLEGCPVELGTIWHNADKSVYFDVARRRGERFAQNQEQWDRGQFDFAGFPPNRKYMRIAREIYLSANRAAVFRITRALDGDFIATGMMLQQERKKPEEEDVYRAWAARVSSGGTMKWEFVDVQTIGVKSPISQSQLFSDAVELHNGATMLCGTTVDGDGHQRFLLDQLGPDGKLIAERTLLPSTVKGPFVVLSACIQSNNDVVLVGTIMDRSFRYSGWIAELDEKLDVVYEKRTDDCQGSAIAAEGGRFFTITSTKCGRPSRNVITEFGPSAEIVAQYELSKNDPSQGLSKYQWIFVQPETSRANPRLVQLVMPFPWEGQDPIGNEILSFDDRLSSAKRLRYAETGVAATALELQDGSVAIFGSSFNGHGIPSWIQMTLVHPEGTHQLFSLMPDETVEYGVAAQTDNPHEFVAVPVPIGGPNPPAQTRPVLDWVSLGD
jgi:hypothetical protein